MGGLLNPFGFAVHHIFPRDLYTNNESLADAFHDAGIDLDAKGNKVGLPNNAETAAWFGSDPSYAQAGFGTSAHRGGHDAYDRFIRSEANKILDGYTPGTPLTDAQKASLAGLHKFATDVSYGRVDGVGVGSSDGDLGKAYDTDTYKGASGSEKVAHVAGLDTTKTDVGAESNAQERADRVSDLVDKAEANGSRARWRAPRGWSSTTRSVGRKGGAMGRDERWANLVSISISLIFPRRSSNDPEAH